MITIYEESTPKQSYKDFVEISPLETIFPDEVHFHQISELRNYNAALHTNILTTPATATIVTCLEGGASRRQLPVSMSPHSHQWLKRRIFLHSLKKCLLIPMI